MIEPGYGAYVDDLYFYNDTIYLNTELRKEDIEDTDVYAKDDRVYYPSTIVRLDKEYYVKNITNGIYIDEFIINMDEKEVVFY